MKYLIFSFILWISIVDQGFAQVHTSYLWHMQQPIYWPEKSASDTNRYQVAWESHVLKSGGGNLYSDGLSHPLNDLFQIFSKADRVAAYQYRPKDAVQTMSSLADAGAQVNYSGCLIENINSLAAANQWGYSSNWASHFQTARAWTTTDNHPKMDITGFSFHHVLSPLVSENILRKQIQMHRHIYAQTFGTSPDYSKGYWPAECSFSERIIKVLVEEGFEWSVIANSHLARTLNDYPLSFGTSGTNYDPPNKADVVSTNGNNWWNGQIDGRGGTFAAPYCYQPHKAKYVDPETGVEFIITVVPMADLLSYQNGFSLMGTNDIDNHIAPYEDPNHPSLILMAHDGDNAWGGGYDYYLNSVPQLANAAAGNGYKPSTIQQYLEDFPVAANDIVHVEDGSWVNAANDWGHPQFINWLWPLYNSNQRFDPNGWTEDARNWAVLTAAENYVEMADHLSGGSDISKIVSPDAASSYAEKAWHHLMPGYTSGYMYYGKAIDMEVKQTLASNLAITYANKEIAQHQGTDNTPPSVFIPQRYPYNPGGTGFGPNYAYQQFQNSSDFHVWTFADDVSGIQSATLKFRTDFDGTNPLSDNENDTYAGGSSVSGWQSIAMTMRIFPVTNVTNDPEVDFFLLPDAIADLYYAEITGLSDTLIDYFVEVTDSFGNTRKTAIQHVFVGPSNVGSGPTNPNVTWEPIAPNLNDSITITISNAPGSGKLHWGVNTWQNPIPAYRPNGTVLFGGIGSAVQTPMNGPNSNNELSIQIGPFNNPSQIVDNISFVINYDDNTWDNNNGADYFIPIENNVAACQPVAQNYSSNIAAGSVRLNWSSVTNSEGYEIRGKAIGSPWISINVNGASNTFIDINNLDQLKSYAWQVRTICDFSAGIYSSFSTLDTFSFVSNPNCTAPAAILSNNITPTSVKLNWFFANAADQYEIQGGVLGSSNVISVLINAPLTFLNVSNLPSNTSYVWKIRSLCNGSPSAFTVSDTFTTLSVNKFLSNQDAGIQIYPNPVNDFLQIMLPDTESDSWDIQVFDLSGNEVMQMADQKGNHFRINTSIFSSGLYRVIIKGDQVFNRKIVVN